MMNFNRLVHEIRKLNPGIEIRVGCNSLDSKASERIFCDFPLSQIKLPDNYHFENNVITREKNDGITKFWKIDEIRRELVETSRICTSEIRSLVVEPLKHMPLGITYPALDYSENEVYYDIEKYAIMVQKLNPGALICLDYTLDNTICSNYSLYDLVLPNDDPVDMVTGEIDAKGKASILPWKFKQIDIDKDTIKGIRYNPIDEIREQALKDMNNGFGQKVKPSIFEQIDKRVEDVGDKIKTGVNNIADQHRSNPDRIKGRHFTIVAKEKELDQAASRRGRNAVMAGACIMAAAGAALLHDANIMVSVEQMLSSWEGFAQTFTDMGPISNVLTASASLFMARYFRRTREYHKIENQIQNLNDAYDESLIKGEDNDARSR